jgi:hypothetical protein
VKCCGGSCCVYMPRVGGTVRPAAGRGSMHVDGRARSTRFILNLKSEVLLQYQYY